MSYHFPETPILLYPSLAETVGVEAAVLMTLYQQQAQRLEALSTSGSKPELILSAQQWLQLGRFWDEENLAQLTNTLVEAGFIDATFAHDGRVRIRFSESGRADTEVFEQVEEVVEEPEIEMVSRLPVVEAVPPAPPVEAYSSEPYTAQDTPYYPDTPNQPVPPPSREQRQPNPGPAPTFGGSIGWARKAQQIRSGQGDELQAKFFQQEQLKKQLQAMDLGWQPSQNFYALLPRHSISVQFAQSCLDEFVLYWLDKDRKETNWDQKFLGWVKREWVKKQTQEGRQQRLSNEQNTGFSHENPRRDTRENRKRVTAAVMDIKDTDW